MKRRALIRVISYLLAAIVIATVFCVKYYKKTEEFKTEISYTYSRSLEEVNSSLNKISVVLEKLPYVYSAGQMTKLATDVYTEAKIAKLALSQLPTGQPSQDNLNKFFSQVGNYSAALAQRVVDGGEVSQSEKENLELLSGIAQNISDSFSEIQMDVNNNEHWSNLLEENIGVIAENDLFVNSLNVLEESITDYPTLLYDGPYSDHISTVSSYLIEKSQPVTEETALNIAANALGIDKTEISVDDYDNGKIPAINFVYGEGTASISINGGYLISFRKFNVGETSLLSYQQAQIKAEKFVAENLNKTFTVNYYFYDNGICVFNFARVENKVIIYPDLVKVGVDMSNGDIVFFEARPYLMNYKERTIKLPDETLLTEAENMLEESLTVISSATAIIPTSGELEKTCFEFLCKAEDEKEFLIYINPETKNIEDIFTVFKTNGGTLVK